MIISKIKEISKDELSSEFVNQVNELDKIYRKWIIEYIKSSNVLFKNRASKMK